MPWRVFLSRRSIAVRGTAGPRGGPSSVLTALMVHERAISSQRSPLSPHGYSGRAAIPRAEASGGTSPLRRITAAFRRRLMALADPPAAGGTAWDFTGQCGRPLCPGDPTKHLACSAAVTECPPRRDRLGSIPMLPQVTEFGTHARPNRDTSRTDAAWPLRHRELLRDAGCVPPLTGSSSDDSSVRTRIRTGRI